MNSFCVIFYYVTLRLYTLYTYTRKKNYNSLTITFFLLELKKNMRPKINR